MTTKFDKIKETFKEVLTDITDAVGLKYGTPMIAGGAVRDLICDRPIKDIDVWLVGDPLAVYEDIKKKYGMTNVGFAFGLLYGTMDKDVAGLINIQPYDFSELPIKEKYSGYPVQIIILREGIKYPLSRFDFGICRASCYLFDNEIQIEATEEFNTDQHNETFTLISTHDKERSYERFERLTEEKYQGWTLVEPDNKEE